MQQKNKKNIVLALPKGRILKQLLPILKKAGIKIDKEFFEEDTRKLFFSTNIDYLTVIKCRSFDTASFTAYGAADLAICGLDVLEEFSYKNIYNLLDLKIGKCRLSVAGTKQSNKEFAELERVKIATKYPKLTEKFFTGLGVQVETIKLNGAIEVAASLGLCDYIVDLVSTGQTLKTNGLEETQKILDVSSRLIVNKASLVAFNKEANEIIERFKKCLK